MSRIDDLIATLCLHCGQNMIRPSAPRSVLDHVLSKLFIKRFRCRGCMKRVFRFCAPWSVNGRLRAPEPISRYDSRKTRKMAA